MMPYKKVDPAKLCRALEHLCLRIHNRQNLSGQVANEGTRTIAASVVDMLGDDDHEIVTTTNNWESACHMRDLRPWIPWRAEIRGDGPVIDSAYAIPSAATVAMLLQYLELIYNAEKPGIITNGDPRPKVENNTTTDPTKPKWTPDKVDKRIRLELSAAKQPRSDDRELEKQWLFGTCEQIAKEIGCGRKTVLNSKWWKEDRKNEQAAWRRNCSRGENVPQPKSTGRRGRSAEQRSADIGES